MALKNFRAPPLPNPPSEYDPQYIRQLIRSLELYHGQLDSNTPNYAQSYTASNFYGTFVATSYTSAEKAALSAVAGMVIFDTTLDKLCVYSGAAWETITSV